MDDASRFPENQQNFSDDLDCTKSDASIFYTVLAQVQLRGPIDIEAT